MDFTNVTKALTARGFKVSSFETAKEAAEYLNSQIDGATVGFGGSITLEELGLYALLSGHNMEMSRNVQSGNTQNLKSMVIQRSFPKWSVAERRKTAAASNQAACCACTHSRYLAGGSPSGLRV